MTEATPLIVMVAPNGARKTAADHPAVPVTAAETARTAAACREAGAAMIHLHVRDRDQKHLLDADAYRETIDAVRQAAGPELIVQITTEAVGMYAPAEQMAVVRDVRPEAVSLAVRELCPDPSHEQAMAAFCQWMQQEAILPQYILYSGDDVARFGSLRAQGIIPDAQPFVLYVLGRYAAGQRSDPSDLLPFLQAAAGHDYVWSMCAFGQRESACALTAAALDGHVRVGFENNTLLADGSTAPDNAALVAQIAKGARLIGRPVASPAEARKILGVGR